MTGGFPTIEKVRAIHADLIGRFGESGADRVVLQGQGDSTDGALRWLEESALKVLG